MLLRVCENKSNEKPQSDQDCNPHKSAQTGRGDVPDVGPYDEQSNDDRENRLFDRISWRAGWLHLTRCASLTTINGPIRQRGSSGYGARR